MKKATFKSLSILKHFFAITFSFFTLSLFAQNGLSGKVIDSATRVPLVGVTILLSPVGQTDATDENGRFYYKKLSPSERTITVSAVGYQQKTFLLNDFKDGQTVSLTARQTQLADVVITLPIPVTHTRPSVNRTSR